MLSQEQRTRFVRISENVDIVAVVEVLSEASDQELQEFSVTAVLGPLGGTLGGLAGALGGGILGGAAAGVSHGLTRAVARGYHASRVMSSPLDYVKALMTQVGPEVTQRIANEEPVGLPGFGSAALRGLGLGGFTGMAGGAVTGAGAAMDSPMGKGVHTVAGGTVGAGFGILGLASSAYHGVSTGLLVARVKALQRLRRKKHDLFMQAYEELGYAGTQAG